MCELLNKLNVSENSDFSIHNIPFGCCEYNNEHFVATRLGNYVINLKKLARLVAVFPTVVSEKFSAKSLNPFIKLGKKVTSSAREKIIELLSSKSILEFLNEEDLFIDSDKVIMLMPINVGDYTDFYSSIEHARNVGSMFRNPKKALNENWMHLPVAYHGRASSIRVSGYKFPRPKGQINPDNKIPFLSATNALDFELEMAFITFDGKPQGDTIATDDAEDYIFGLCLFNDWSARDIQKWEYVPLGPFLGKNFASVISPWVITLDALKFFKVDGPKQEKVLPYLVYSGKKNIDIKLEVAIKTENAEEKTVCRANTKDIYWNMSQQLAHHTINGCNIRAGDVMGSGCISGKEEGSYGSMLEITKMGKKPVEIANGIERKYIEDGDTVIMKAYAEKENVRVGFGELKSKVLNA